MCLPQSAICNLQSAISADVCLRYLPLTFAILFIGGLVGYRAVRFSRLYGHSPIHVPRAGDPSAHAFLSRVLVACFAVILALTALAALWPDALEAADPLYAHRHPALLGPGVVLAALATWLVWRGQEDMAASWRIGIASAERTDLVTGGLFRFCRNPIYLGLQVALAAFCCLLPGYFSGGLLVLAAVLFQVQARLEEAHLLRQHGAAYAAYRARVGRFLPFTGRCPAPAEQERDEHAD
jgi:protein-S-isoprenylcysteine O-methyltransferase Ste14